VRELSVICYYRRLEYLNGYIYWDFTGLLEKVQEYLNCYRFLQEYLNCYEFLQEYLNYYRFYRNI